MNYYYATGTGVEGPTWIHALAPLFFLLPLVILWTIFWKGLALWHAGRKAQTVWFIVLLIINTLGILEIIYLFGVLKLKFHTLFSK